MRRAAGGGVCAIWRHHVLVSRRALTDGAEYILAHSAGAVNETRDTGYGCTMDVVSTL